MRLLRRSAFLVAVLVFNLTPSGPVFAEERLIDTERSTITVRVFHEGLTSAVASDYIIRAPILEGSFDPMIPHMQLVIDARRMRVLDGGLSRRDREEVQAWMLGSDVLDAERFPWISFHSVEIVQLGKVGWLLQGELWLHGQIRATPVSVIPGHNRYKGSTTLRQSDFGIAPAAVAGGMVAVKDEITVDFDIVIAEERLP